MDAESAEARKKHRWLPSPLQGVAAITVGMLIGMGGFALVYSDATSYLGSDPKTCANCHAMRSHYDNWSRGPHAHVATCDDCHLPHDNILDKYKVQAEDGVLHVTKFTLGDYPDNIVARPSSVDVINGACLHCHGDLTASMRAVMGTTDGNVSCVRCHSGVGH